MDRSNIFKEQLPAQRSPVYDLCAVIFLGEVRFYFLWMLAAYGLVAALRGSRDKEHYLPVKQALRIERMAVRRDE
ncbi:MAG: hypothetical protein WA542_01965 [Candidatus Acidiferrum sp.]